MEKITIDTPTIALDKALKWAAILPSGGAIRPWLDAGHIQINGEMETRKRRKLQHGDVIAIEGVGTWQIEAPQDASDD